MDYLGRSVSLTHRAQDLQQALVESFPVDRYPVDIDVSGGPAQTYMTLHISAPGKSIDITRRVCPEDFIAYRDPRKTSLLITVTRILEKVLPT